MARAAVDAAAISPDAVREPREVPAAPVALSRRYVNGALTLLLLIYIVNFLDRQVINILAEPIKNELGLRDWQIGMMSGFAFAVLYTVLGIPIARLAEYRNRPVIISVSLAAWSGMTVLCGVAQNFVQLCLFRVGVGIGEAGCTPPAHSLISDYVPKARRASALAFYSMGVPLGSLLGMALGGLVADRYGWRAAFMVVGAPGLLLAVITLLVLKETRSKLLLDVATARSNRVPFADAMRLLAGKRTFWLIAFAAAMKAFITYGHAPFIASFFLRNHAEQIAGIAAGFKLQSVGFLGLAIGLITGLFGALSAVLGGWFADRAAANGPRNIMLAPALAMLISVPVFTMAVLVEDARLALLLLVVPYLLGNMWYGPVYSTTQGIVPPQMRATAAAILLFIINLIGLGLGPLLTGILSDLYATRFGLGPGDGVRWALITASGCGLVSSWLFFRSRRTICQDLEA